MERDPSSTTTRRRLLGTAAAATGAVIATAALAREAAAATVGPTTNLSSPSGQRATSVGNFGFELAGVQQGTLRGADGGDTYAEVAIEPTGGKHLGQVKLDDFTVDFGLSGLSSSFYEFAVNLMGWRLVETTGKLLSGDVNRNVTAARAFTNPRFSELAIPALNAGLKDPGFLSLSFHADSASDATPAGTIQSQPTSTNRWLVSGYRLDIDDALGAAHVDCALVSKIDAITITDNGSRVEFPNLVVTFGAASLPGWKAWFNDFVINGNNGQANERSGRITLLGINSTTPLGVLQLHNIGICKLDPDGEANPGGPARAIAELYVETMNFSQLGTWVNT